MPLDKVFSSNVESADHSILDMYIQEHSKIWENNDKKLLIATDEVEKSVEDTHQWNATACPEQQANQAAVGLHSSRKTEDSEVLPFDWFFSEDDFQPFEGQPVSQDDVNGWHYADFVFVPSHSHAKRIRSLVQVKPDIIQAGQFDDVEDD